MVELLLSVGIESLAFGSSAELLAAELPDRPGCMVLDVRMPGISGLELQSTLAGRAVRTPVIFLTGHGDVPMTIQAMKAGACDFLTKPVRSQTLLDAVLGAIAIDRAQRRASLAERRNRALFAKLTPRERQIFKAVALGQLNKQIAYDLNISEVTVKLHRGGMMKKLAASTVADVVHIWESLPPAVRKDD
ncbi:response regulator transcription factor [Sphingomonas crocodyli]|uniref:Response regulator transcription factor n=2 Tax=Sphingomonas crocodyli TaxID=1979270 RepID=A0A437M168_9SPHN|nr:response regulator transcription factor [Sphingomonas crocodyli]